jgi:hypothetical protein
LGQSRPGHERGHRERREKPSRGNLSSIHR